MFGHTFLGVPRPYEEDDLCFVLDHLTVSELEANRRRADRVAARITGLLAENKQLKAECVKQQKLASDAEAGQKRAETQLAEERRRVTSRLWAKECEHFFAKEKNTTFITGPEIAEQCRDVSCELRRKEPGNITTCKHEIKSTIQGSGNFNAAFLKQERLRWYPDRFALANAMITCGKRLWHWQRRCTQYLRTCTKSASRHRFVEDTDRTNVPSRLVFGRCCREMNATQNASHQSTDFSPQPSRASPVDT